MIFNKLKGNLLITAFILAILLSACDNTNHFPRYLHEYDRLKEIHIEKIDHSITVLDLGHLKLSLPWHIDNLQPFMSGIYFEIPEFCGIIFSTNIYASFEELREDKSLYAYYAEILGINKTILPPQINQKLRDSMFGTNLVYHFTTSHSKGFFFRSPKEKLETAKTVVYFVISSPDESLGIYFQTGFSNKYDDVRIRQIAEQFVSFIRLFPKIDPLSQEELEDRIASFASQRDN